MDRNRFNVVLFAVLCGVVLTGSTALAEGTSQVKRKNEAVANDGAKKGVIDFNDADATTPDAVSSLAHGTVRSISKTFLPPENWKFKAFKNPTTPTLQWNPLAGSAQYVDICADPEAFGIQCLTDTETAVKIEGYFTTPTNAGNFPLSAEGNLQRPAGHGGKGIPAKPPEYHWSAKVFDAVDGYVIAFYADTVGIGHGFIKIRFYNQPGQWIGYGFHPNGGIFGAPGQMETDTNHVWNRKLCFRIDHTQYLKVMEKVESWRTRNYYLIGQNCVSFVYDVSDVALGLSLSENPAEGMNMESPGFLFQHLGHYSQAIDNNGSSTAEVQETETQIIDIRPH